jgi:hypothetical protein
MLKEKKFRKGGVSWDSAVPAFVLIIVLLIVLIPFATKTVFGASDTMTNWWEMWFGGATPKPKPISELEAAIVCSYYRCMKGCSSKEVNDLKMKFDEKLFDCASFCENSEGKICDENAMRTPIKVDVGGKEDISKQDFGFAPCIMRITNYDDYPGGDFINIQKTKVKLIEEEECKSESYGILKGAVKKATIDAGTYYIWTRSKTLLGMWGQTIVWSELPTVTSTQTSTEPSYKPSQD